MSRLAKLHCTYAAPLIIRSLFETAAQFEYLMQQPEQRASQYLEFEHVTCKLRMDAALNAPIGPLFDRIRASPLRGNIQPMVDQAFQNVQARYARSKGGFPTNWYAMQFKQLVDRLNGSTYDWKTEHDVWYRLYSAWAHGDPFSTKKDDPMASHARLGLHECYIYVARMLLRVVDDGQIILASEQHGLLREMAKGFNG